MTKTKRANDPQKLAALQRRLGYEFSDLALLQRALSHRSYSGENNERLEYLGDSILGFVIADVLFQDEPNADEGRLTRLRAAVVREPSLAKVARELELGQYLYMGTGEYRSGGFARDSILADALEAVIAAIYLDSDFARASLWVRQQFASLVDAACAAPTHKDPKTRLQERMQAQGAPLPDYEVLQVSGLSHQQAFEVRCSIQTPPMSFSATGSSRRKAEQAAAATILERLESADG